ncbi:hypothetical protein LCGC14_0355880 [marine sediment metagenome]|uniref:Uncharacterized protein n=1 Tax=marine sediment metagenome TaxID=412755 RepID=A0A0F9VWM1_9ZZZZ
MNNIDKDKTVITRCPIEGCNEIMGRNNDGDLVCTTCEHVVEIGTHTHEPVVTLQDSLEMMTSDEIENAIRDAANGIMAAGYDPELVRVYTDQIVICVTEQKYREMI